MTSTTVARPRNLISRDFSLLLLTALCVAFIASHEVLACSSFLMEKDGVFIAGRNPDSNKFTSGAIVINKRGIRKESRSWNELAYGEEVANPQLTWVSKYGSIALNTFGRDFVDGKPVLTYGKAMPVKVLANETYVTEMDRLLKYDGFGGDKLVLLKGGERQRDPDEPVEDDRFVKAATLINRGPDSPLAPLDYGMTIQFRTKDSPRPKTLSFADFDFDAASPTLMLDVHATGDVGPMSFTEYSLELNRDQLFKKISGWESVFTSNGATLDGALDRISSYPETTVLARPFN